jgi:hypothetical protein
MVMIVVQTFFSCPDPIFSPRTESLARVDFRQTPLSSLLIINLISKPEYRLLFSLSGLIGWLVG